MTEETIPPTVREYLRIERPEKLITWWESGDGYLVVVPAPGGIDFVGFPLQVGHWGHQLHGMRFARADFMDGLLRWGAPQHAIDAVTRYVGET